MIHPSITSRFFFVTFSGQLWSIPEILFINPQNSVQWSFQEPIYWRYLPFIRPTIINPQVLPRFLMEVETITHPTAYPSVSATSAWGTAPIVRWVGKKTH